MTPAPRRRILLQVTGSIAAFKAVALCSRLAQAGFEIDAVLSESAEAFVGAASFEGLTRKKTHRGIFDEGAMLSHIDLIRAADLALVYPASADTIAALASGRAHSLIGALFLAHRFDKPYWVAPAMNSAMFEHPATQASLKTLRNWGVRVLAPGSGSLACGEIGAGRLQEPDAVFEEIRAHFRSEPNPSAAKKKVVVTAGGTLEPIDAVRAIANASTGETGFRIAQTLFEAGHDVTLLTSKRSPFQTDAFPCRAYLTVSDLEALMRETLQDPELDAFVHAAAVSDFKIDSIQDENGNPALLQGKVGSGSALTVKLVPGPKLLSQVRSWAANPKLKLISFKLTAGEAPALDAYAHSDWIVHNDAAGVSSRRHRTTLYRHEGRAFVERARYDDKTSLAKALSRIVSESFPNPAQAVPRGEA